MFGFDQLIGGAIDLGIGAISGGGLSRSEKRAKRNELLSILRAKGMRSTFKLDNSDNWAVLKFYVDRANENPKWITAINQVVGSEGGTIRGTDSTQFARVSKRFDELKFQDVPTGTESGDQVKSAGFSIGKIGLAAGVAFALSQLK